MLTGAPNTTMLILQARTRLGGLLPDESCEKTQDYVATLNCQRRKCGIMDFNGAVGYWLPPIPLRVGQDSSEDFNSIPEIFKAQVFIDAVLVGVMVHDLASRRIWSRSDFRAPSELVEICGL